MKRLLVLIGLLALLSACAGNRTATVTWSDDGLGVTMTAPKGSVVKAEQNGKKAEFDDRGEPSILRTIVEAGVVRTMTKD